MRESISEGNKEDIGNIQSLKGVGFGEYEKKNRKNWRENYSENMELISNNPQITRKELADSIGISEDGIKFHLNNLKKKDILKRIGPDKGGHWKVSKKR